jgi:Cdc6-like AAA superfamily ATPase
MYLINKYKINNKNDIKFHFNIYNKLLKKDNYEKICEFLDKDNDYDKYYNKLVNNEYKDYNDMSNLIIYGPKGSGKKTLINILLKDIYGYLPKLQ